MGTTAFFGEFSVGLVLALGAIGSALGIGAAGRAAAGAWAKEGKEGKPLRFTYIVLVGMPLSQTIYSFIFMFIGLKNLAYDYQNLPTYAGALLGLGLACGLAEMFSAWVQGLIGAAAVRCMSESEGKGLAFLIISMGIAETVGLFAWVFLLLVKPGIGA